MKIGGVSGKRILGSALRRVLERINLSTRNGVDDVSMDVDRKIAYHAYDNQSTHENLFDVLIFVASVKKRTGILETNYMDIFRNDHQFYCSI